MFSTDLIYYDVDKFIASDNVSDTDISGTNISGAISSTDRHQRTFIS